MTLGKKMIFELQLGKKKEQEINYMCAEPLHKAWAIFDPIIVHVTQLLHYRLFMRFPISLVKLVEIWLDFLHIRIHIKHGIVPLLVHNKICTSIPNTFTLPLRNLQFSQWNFFYYLVSPYVSTHVVGALEIHA
jgi:hypothetical protein